MHFLVDIIADSSFKNRAKKMIEANKIERSTAIFRDTFLVKHSFMSYLQC